MDDKRYLCPLFKRYLDKDDMNKAIFLDRDGTINVEKHYLYKEEDFEFLPGVVETLADFKKNGYLLILVTNQSGIARGYYREEDMHRLHAFMQSKLDEKGAKLDAIYFCPHHPQAAVGAYRINCNCRKPLGGLFDRAIEEWKIDVTASWAIGDKERDLRYPHQSGMKTILLQQEECESEYPVCKNWDEIRRKILPPTTQQKGRI